MRANGARAASAARSRPTSTTASASPSAAGGRPAATTARSWFGRTDGSSPPGRRRRPAGRGRPRGRTARERGPGAPRAARASRSVAERAARRSSSASIQSAFTSTGLPTRGVTGTPSTARPSTSAPDRPRPGAAGRRRVDADSEARAGEMAVDDRLAAPGRAPRRGRRLRCTATCRPSAWTNQSVPSAVLYSSVPVSAVFASMPSETVAAARSSAVASLLRASGREEEPLVGGHQVARPLAEPGVAGNRRRAVVSITNWSAARTSCASAAQATPACRTRARRALAALRDDRPRRPEARRRKGPRPR